MSGCYGAGRPKRARAYEHCLYPRLLLVLRQHRVRQDKTRQRADWQEHGLVFPSSIGTLMEPGNLHRRFKAVLVRAGLPTTIRFMTFATVVQHLLAQGVPLVVVRDTLGHTQISTTADIYGHVLPDMHRQAVSCMTPKSARIYSPRLAFRKAVFIGDPGREL